MKRYFIATDHPGADISRYKSQLGNFTIAPIAKATVFVRNVETGGDLGVTFARENEVHKLVDADHGVDLVTDSTARKLGGANGRARQ